MRKITELTHQDFPATNPGKFDEWKKVMTDWIKSSKLLPFIVLGMLLFQFFINAVFGGIIGGIIIICLFVYMFNLKSKSKKLLVELGNTDEDIKNACSK